MSKTLGDLLGPLMFAVLMGIARAAFGRLGSTKILGRVMAVCAVGALALRKDPKRRTALWIAAAAGLFVGAAALLVRWNMLMLHV